MEGSRKPLAISRTLMIVVFLAAIGITTSPFTQHVTPIYPMYSIFEFDEHFELNDYNLPILEFGYPSADKVVIKELTTNGSAVNIALYKVLYHGDPVAVIENITHISDCIIAAMKTNLEEESEYCPLFRISRYDNHSVEAHLVLKVWIKTYNDNIITGPSVFLVLLVPLFLVAMKTCGRRPTTQGYIILVIIILSGILISPILVYSYNHMGVLIRNEEVLPLQDYNLTLDDINPMHELNIFVNASDNYEFTRIANFTTNNGSVSIRIIQDETNVLLDLTNVTTTYPDAIGFEFPNKTTSIFTVQITRIDQNVSLSLSIQSVHVFYTIWFNPLPYNLSALVGLVIFIISLLFLPQSEKKLIPKSGTDIYTA